MSFSEIKSKLGREWSSLEASWKDEYTVNYRSGCIDVLSNVLMHMQRSADEFERELTNIEREIQQLKSL